MGYLFGVRCNISKKLSWIIEGLDKLFNSRRPTNYLVENLKMEG